jgi:hypothetical protein
MFEEKRTAESSAAFTSKFFLKRIDSSRCGKR